MDFNARRLADYFRRFPGMELEGFAASNGLKAHMPMVMDALVWAVRRGYVTGIRGEGRPAYRASEVAA
jgi:hypothetical protein